MTLLQTFLVEDVRALVGAIERDPALADMPGGCFDTLADFAAYLATAPR